MSLSFCTLPWFGISSLWLVMSVKIILNCIFAQMIKSMNFTLNFSSYLLKSTRSKVTLFFIALEGLYIPYYMNYKHYALKSWYQNTEHFSLLNT